MQTKLDSVSCDLQVKKECPASHAQARKEGLPSVKDFLLFQIRVENQARLLLGLDMKRWGTVKSSDTAKAVYDMAKLSFKGGYGPPSECGHGFACMGCKGLIQP